MSHPIVPLIVIGGGAAQGLVDAVRDRFRTETGFDLTGTFGAVGAMRAAVARDAADVVILTRPLIDALTKEGHLRAGTAADVGIVATGIAVRSGAAKPPIGSADALRVALLAADAVYVADLRLATAGIHFAKVLDGLGIAGELASRLRPHPNGQTAMRAMAAGASSGERHPLGCTQATEILITPGVDWAGPLPHPFGLATTYTAAIATRSADPDAAARLISLLSSPAQADLRLKLGFERPS